MYNIKELIKKMKIIAQVDSNIKLAKVFNVSYNTLNTWLKRNKFPQELLIEFCIKYNCSLDYLILNKDLYNEHKKEIKNELVELNYYGEYEKLNIHFKSKLILQKNKLINNGFYLVKKNEIEFIAQINFNPFTNKAKLIFNNFSYEITLEELKKMEATLIIDVK